MTVNLDMEYLREHLEAVDLVPFDWNGEDKNLRAFRSKDELVAWYSQPPGVDGEPYRDRGFYCRELAMLSRTIRPQTIVEFGTSLGIGTCLLRWLNPNAYQLITVDLSVSTYLPGDVHVPMGYLARYQGIDCWYAKSNSWEYECHGVDIDCWYAKSNSWEYECHGVDLCFIDADHSYGAVVKDSERAWLNRSRNRPWAIAWHDHNVRHPGVVRAVEEFCAARSMALQARPDSDTVWIEGGG